jgi:alanyl-tRNA synthetase
MKTTEIRRQFLSHFEQNGHTIVPSSSLVPGNDPTLLFTNAGMVQFKETFLGVEKRPYTRATSSQRCVRAGGKHNDLENVGHTARHHTFFEMLGNFSFGDYFKREAIQLAWQFLTEVLKLPSEKLWVTVYEEDSESEDIWLKEMGVDATRFSRCSAKDNFWSMGGTGPCGPCTEIFYDHGPQVAGGPPGSPEEDGDRYIEIWNLVFMQYNRSADGSMTPLPNPCVDTGMGLERIAAVLQGVHNNYDIDLFQGLLAKLAEVTGQQDISQASMRVIVDHIRSSSFMMVDGIVPSNEGRGYVLRRIIRRALRHGYKLGMKEPFFYKLVPALCEEMGEAYPELNDHREMIQNLLQREEQQFMRTLSNGLKLYAEVTAQLVDKIIPGETVFQLYDTYGFPPDLTADMAREQGLTIDEQGFEKAMQRQRQQSQQSQRFKVDQSAHMHLTGETDFIGYNCLSEEAVIETMLQNQQPCEILRVGEEGVLVLNQTPFYAESGGQIGDTGLITKSGARFEVKDTQKQGHVILHWGRVTEGEFNIKDTVRAEVNALRDQIRCNHSATHLLHQALRKVLGSHVSQKGSLVDAQRLRFDFTHTSAVSKKELEQIEQLVNQQIRANHAVSLTEQSLDDAKASGAMALFGEKYADVVRVIQMGDFSTEICGGTHVERTGDIGLFKITQESACSAGVRRIEAMTSEPAMQWVNKRIAQFDMLSSRLKAQSGEAGDKLDQLFDQLKQQQRDIEKLQAQLISGQSTSLTDQVRLIKDVHVIAVQLPEVDRDALRQTMDQLKSKYEKVAIVLATVKDGKVVMIAGVTKVCLPVIKAPDLLKHIATQIDGKSGGRPDMAQGGGNNPDALPAALETIYPLVESLL